MLCTTADVLQGACASCITVGPTCTTAPVLRMINHLLLLLLLLLQVVGQPL
jgi:hypothetical protein